MTNELVTPQVGVCSHCQKVKEIRKVEFYFPLIELQVYDPAKKCNTLKPLVQEVSICHNCTAKMMHFIEIPISDDMLQRLTILDTKTAELYTMISPMALRRIELDNPWKEERISFFDNRFITMAMHFGFPDVVGKTMGVMERNTYGRIFAPSEFSYMDSSSHVGEKRYIIFTMPETVRQFIHYNLNVSDFCGNPKVQLTEEIYELLLNTLKTMIAEFNVS